MSVVASVVRGATYSHDQAAARKIPAASATLPRYSHDSRRRRSGSREKFVITGGGGASWAAADGRKGA
jgi:hypothetical protein